MSFEYDAYLRQHKQNVKRGLDWIRENVPELIYDDISFGGNIDYEWQIGSAHDQSKSKPEEYAAYDAYFYGNNKSYSVVQNFNRAWLSHIHENPHHWQHWVLINDEPNEGEVILKMPRNYAVEMVCDWWAFSWAKENLYEIFDWYDQRRDYIKLHPSTRTFLEDALRRIRQKLDEMRDVKVSSYVSDPPANCDIEKSYDA